MCKVTGDLESCTLSDRVKHQPEWTLQQDMDRHRGTSQFPLIPETDPGGEPEPAHPTPKVNRHCHPIAQTRGVGGGGEDDPYSKEKPPVHDSSAACFPGEQQFEDGVDPGIDGYEHEEQPGNDYSPASQQVRQQGSGPGVAREPRQRAARQQAGNDRLDAAAGGSREEAALDRQQTSSCVAPATSEAETTCVDGRVATLKGENEEVAVDQTNARVGEQQGAEVVESGGRQHPSIPAAKQGGATAHKARGRSFAVEEQPPGNEARPAAAKKRPGKASQPRELDVEAAMAGTMAKPTRMAGNSKRPAAAALRGLPSHRAKGEKKQAQAGGNRATGPQAKRPAVKEGSGQLPVEASQPDWLTDHSHAAADEVQASYQHKQ